MNIKKTRMVKTIFNELNTEYGERTIQLLMEWSNFLIIERPHIKF